MTTTTTHSAERTPATAPTGTHASTTGSPGTSGVVASLLMVTGIGWNAGLEARPFHPAMTGVTALVIHILPLVALMVFLVPALASPRRRRGVSVAAVMALAFGLISAVFSITHPHAVMGIHDINDVLPIAILDTGALLWLVRGRRPGISKADRATAGRTAAGKISTTRTGNARAAGRTAFQPDRRPERKWRNDRLVVC